MTAFSTTIRLASSALALTVATAAFAQESSAPNDADASSPANDIVVTGTPRRDGLNRLDAGFSISTISQDQVERLAPRSTADILRLVPGIFVETSGGTAGVHVGVRGFPQNGGGAFATVQLDGSPIFAPNTLSFLETFSLFRIDDTVERTEVLRGGPSPVFSNGQPGVTVNFIQKKGTDNPEGSVRLTAGAQGMGRVDAYASGPLGNGWYLSAGGFYRFDDGIRDTQYVGDKGGQFSANLTKRWDGLGEISLYVRKVHDQNAFFSGAPLQSTNNGADLDVYPYFDQRKDTLAGNANRYQVLEISPGATPGTVSRDFGDGRTVDLTQFGGSVNLTPGDGWTISDNFSFLDGRADVRAIFTSAVPTTLGAYITSRLGAASTVGRGAATSGTGSFVGGGAAAASQPVIVAGLWSIDKDLRSFTNELRVSKSFGANTLTIGGYYADYSVDDLWYQGNNALFAFEPNARLINVTLNNGAQLTRNGIVSATTGQTRASWNGRNLAAFAADEFELSDTFRVDAGVRVEEFKADGTVGLTTANVDLDGNPATLYNNGSTVLNGGTRTVAYKQTKVSYTAGANWRFLPDFSAFARVNSGYKFPHFDDLREGSRVVQKVDQYEIGFKTAQPWLSAGLTLFYNKFKGQTYTQQVVNPDNSITTVVAIAGSRVWGAELDGVLRPFDAFQLRFNGTLMDGEFRDITAGVATGVQNGNQIQRQPRFQARVEPSYTIPLGETTLTLFGAYQHVGKRFSDIQNLQQLPAYDTLDLGATFKAGPLELQGLVTNVTNSLGLTEGNARIIGTTSGSVIARSIFGRAFQLSALYKF
ncbi:MAG: TonB-dependent receptor [Novosphingobium sp.]|nr:MAG: TonB-dependent receptor [Novosphingobium sp.]